MSIKRILKNLKAVDIRGLKSVNVSGKPTISIVSSGNVFTNIVRRYEEITGLDHVKAAQDRVLSAEKKFIEAQESRRYANQKVKDLQSSLRDIYAKLDNTKRGEERYIQLITEEHKLLKQEREATEEFARLEREERDSFSHLSSALKESQKAESMQAEKTKYWSIIGSVVGTIIGIIGSSINNHFKINEMKRVMNEKIETSVKKLERSTNYQDQFDAIMFKLNDNSQKQYIPIESTEVTTQPPSENPDDKNYINNLYLAGLMINVATFFVSLLNIFRN